MKLVLLKNNLEGQIVYKIRGPSQKTASLTSKHFRPVKLAISLHIMLGISFLLTHQVFSASMILGLVTWGYSFIMLQGRLQNQLKSSKRHMHMSQSFQFQFHRLVDDISKWGYLQFEGLLK